MKQTLFTKEGGVIRYRGSPFDLMLATIPNGEYELTIKKKVNRRTLDQNSLMWMWYKCIEDETGTPSQDIHDYYCKKFLRRKVVYNGKEEVVVGSTSKLNTVEMTKYLNQVQADAAAEMGIRLPSPDDEYFNSFTMQYERIRY